MPDSPATDHSHAAIMAILGRVEQKVNETHQCLQDHLVHCGSTHGKLDGQVEGIEDRMGGYATAFSKHGAEHKDIELRIRSLENTGLTQAAERGLMTKLWPVIGGGGTVGIIEAVKRIFLS